MKRNQIRAFIKPNHTSIVISISLLILAISLLCAHVFLVDARSPINVMAMKWWKDNKPSKLKSRIRYNQRPPSLLAPGVLHFRTEQSHKYYFHPKGARITKSSHFMKRYHLGRKINFVCVATGKPRPSIIWLKDGLELNSYSGYEHAGVSIPGIREWRLGKYRLKSKVEIDPAMPKDAGYYECQADNKYAIDRRGFIAKYELN